MAADGSSHIDNNFSCLANVLPTCCSNGDFSMTDDFKQTSENLQSPELISTLIEEFTKLNINPSVISRYEPSPTTSNYCYGF